MRVIITGDTRYHWGQWYPKGSDLDAWVGQPAIDPVGKKLDAIHADRSIEYVIHGVQRVQTSHMGVGTYAGFWAQIRGVAAWPVSSDFETYRNYAGPIRNAKMIEIGKPDCVLAFPGTTDTVDLVKQAEKHGIPVQLIECPEMKVYRPRVSGFRKIPDKYRRTL